MRFISCVDSIDDIDDDRTMHSIMGHPTFNGLHYTVNLYRHLGPRFNLPMPVPLAINLIPLDQFDFFARQVWRKDIFIWMPRQFCHICIFSLFVSRTRFSDGDARRWTTTQF